MSTKGTIHKQKGTRVQGQHVCILYSNLLPEAAVKFINAP